MKKYLYMAPILAILVAAGVFVSFDRQANANPSQLPFAYLQNQTATTSGVFLTPASATSTIIVNTDAADAADINLLFTASSSALSNLNFYVDFSDDNSCDFGSSTAVTGVMSGLGVAYNNQCNWFRESTNAVVGNFIEESTSTIHEWRISTSTALNSSNTFGTKNVTVTNIAARYMRISYGVVGANGTIWSQVVVKKQRP